MKICTIKLFSANKFSVIIRNFEVDENGRRDLSTSFYAENNAEFLAQVEKLKKDYNLPVMKSGKNQKGQFIVQLTEV